MRILIVGCGRVGAGLAKTLVTRGHSVTVVDRDPPPSRRWATTSQGRLSWG